MLISKETKEKNPSAFKHLYNQELLDRLATSLGAAYPTFDAKTFIKLMPRLAPLEMKDRVRLLRDELFLRLPKEFEKALPILIASIQKGSLNGFALWPYTEYVQTYGINHPQRSLDGLKEITKHFTAEWAVRPFLTRYPDQSLKYLEQCAKDKDVHVRRWASEGSRPRLPWGERLHQFIADPTATCRILDTLKYDEELYVRKSVANHLNDIAKDHPGYVVKTLKAWQESAGSKHTKKISWIIHRSLRTLIKAGHTEALALIGAPRGAKVSMVSFRIDKKRISLNERLNFTCTIRSTSKKPQKLVVDYVVHFVKSNKKRSPKVFKLRSFEIPGNQEITLTKSHHMKAITTREYYAGVHLIEIQVNGVVICSEKWTLKL